MKKIPDWTYAKWQEITDLLATLIDIPAALIMYTENEYMEVFVSSHSEGNPYKVGDKEKWYGLYCEAVIKAQKELLVPNALKDKKWNKNPDIALGMISYLGYPINYPDKRPFGTLCVLDSKENAYSDHHKRLIIRFKEIIENDLLNLHEFRSVEEKLNLQLLYQNKELLKLKETAEESERKLRMLFTNMTNGFALHKIITNEKGIPVDYIITELNSAFEKLTGIKAEKVLNKKIKDVFPQIEEEWIQVAGQVALTGTPRTIELFTKTSNKYYYISISSPKKGYFASFFNDITERKEKEAQLNAQFKELKEAKEKIEEHERLLAKIAENFPNSYLAIIEKDFSFSFTSGQEFVKRNLPPNYYLGLKPEEIFGENTDFVKDKFQKTFSGEETRFELYNDEMILLYKNVPLYNEKGEVNRVLAVAEDITEQKRKELELRQAKEKAEENNQLKTEFLHNLSHEIRTPMNGIIGFSDMLDNPDISPEKRKYFSKIVQNSSHQLLKIIDDILEISTLETKQLEVIEESFYLNDLLMELFSVFNLKAKERNIPFYLKKGLPDNESLIVSDPTKLNKILSNLLENALKFTMYGYIELGYNLNGENMTLYVKDTGIGVSPQNQKIIFERFSQEEKELSRKQGGLGLGLSISKENTELLGGHISIESEKGKGSTFFVAIPYKTANKGLLAAFGKPLAHENKANDALTVLVAEDEEVNYLYIETLLERENSLRFNLLHAKNGQEAVDMCLDNKHIDLVLMDIKMPGMNGFEATKKIKSLQYELPIIAQTAYTTESDKELAKQHGCDGFLTKPINKEKLFELIKKHVMAKP